MRFEIELVSADKLTRKLWVFNSRYNEIVLEQYHEQARATTRHKFKGPLWSSMDERSYYSKLGRPKGLPDWVRAEAEKRARDVETVFYVGWFNEESRI